MTILEIILIVVFVSSLSCVMVAGIAETGIHIIPAILFGTFEMLNIWGKIFVYPFIVVLTFAIFGIGQILTYIAYGILWGFATLFIE